MADKLYRGRLMGMAAALAARHDGCRRTFGSSGRVYGRHLTCGCRLRLADTLPA